MSHDLPQVDFPSLFISSHIPALCGPGGTFAEAFVANEDETQVDQSQSPSEAFLHGHQSRQAEEGADHGGWTAESLKGLKVNHGWFTWKNVRKETILRPSWSILDRLYNAKTSTAAVQSQSQADQFVAFNPHGAGWFTAVYRLP